MYLVLVASWPASQCAIRSPEASCLDLSYEVGRIIFQEWPQLVSVYVNELVQSYSLSWDLPETIKAIGITGQILMDIRSLRVQATIGMLKLVSMGHGMFKKSPAPNAPNEVSGRTSVGCLTIFSKQLNILD